MKFEGFDRHAIISEDHPILGSQNSYLARLCECVVDIEQDHCVLDRTLVKRGVNRSSGRHLEMYVGV